MDDKNDRADLARLAVATALEKRVREYVDPHAADNLRTRVDGRARQLYEESGVTQQTVMLNGRKVGTVSARLSKPTTRLLPAVTDVEAFVAWLRTTDGGLLALERLVASSPKQILAESMAEGELPDGVVVARSDQPAQWLGTTVRVDEDGVAEALGPELPGYVQGLLEGGADA